MSAGARNSSKISSTNSFDGGDGAEGKPSAPFKTIRHSISASFYLRPKESLGHLSKSSLAAMVLRSALSPAPLRAAPKVWVFWGLIPIACRRRILLWVPRIRATRSRRRCGAFSSRTSTCPPTAAFIPARPTRVSLWITSCPISPRIRKPAPRWRWREIRIGLMRFSRTPLHPAR